MVQAPHVYHSLHPDVEFDGVIEAATATVSKHGFFSLWRGYTVSALAVVPYITVVALTYQGTTKFFDEIVNSTTVSAVRTPVPVTRTIKVERVVEK